MKIKRSETVAEFLDTIVRAELSNYLKVMRQYYRNPPAHGCYHKDIDQDRKAIKKRIKALKIVLKEYTA